jgi:hypothetical protein
LGRTIPATIEEKDWERESFNDVHHGRVDHADEGPVGRDDGPVDHADCGPVDHAGEGRVGRDDGPVDHADYDEGPVDVLVDGATWEVVK